MKDLYYYPKKLIIQIIIKQLKMVSIIIPTSKDSMHLVSLCKRVKDSMTYMTERDYLEWEILVIDNSSYDTRNVINIVDVLKEKCYPIGMYVRKNEGLSSRILKGIREAKYDIVLIINPQYVISSS